MGTFILRRITHGGVDVQQPCYQQLLRQGQEKTSQTSGNSVSVLVECRTFLSSDISVLTLSS